MLLDKVLSNSQYIQLRYHLSFNLLFNCVSNSKNISDFVTKFKKKKKLYKSKRALIGDKEFQNIFYMENSKECLQIKRILISFNKRKAKEDLH